MRNFLKFHVLCCHIISKQVQSRVKNTDYISSSFCSRMVVCGAQSEFILKTIMNKHYAQFDQLACWVYLKRLVDAPKAQRFSTFDVLKLINKCFPGYPGDILQKPGHVLPW